MKSIAPGICLVLCSVAHAQTVDQGTRAGIDAHAFAYSGRHCAGGIEAEPASKDVTPSQFKIVALLMEEGLKAKAKQDRSFQYRSSFNDKDLFRAVLKDANLNQFVMMFLKANRAYIYKCELR